MECNLEDDGSSASSSSSSSTEITRTNHNDPSPQNAPPLMVLPKRKAGRKKFKETRHPIYRGVRQRNGCKWVCEVREPNKKSRIWLGTFPTPEMAARAHDAAILALRGENATLNFPDSAHLLRRAKSCSAKDIQDAAFEAAAAFRPKRNRPILSLSSSSSPSHSSRNTTIIVKENLKEVEEIMDHPTAVFVDEEPLFNMPSFYNSMAEGLIINPPGMEMGFDWDDNLDYDMDLTLWRD